MNQSNRPTVFIGSSSEGLEFANALQIELDHSCEVERWNQGAFGLSGSSLDSLESATRRFDFAVFVLVPDDTTITRGKQIPVARDNVIFELGLFMGALGRTRTFMVYDRTSPPNLPSDLAGVTPATFALHKSGNLVASVGAACSVIKNAISTLGPRKPNDTGLLAYPSRPPISLEQELDGVQEAWFAWHAGSVKLAQGDLLKSGRSLRVLLTEPGSKALTELGRVANLNGAQMSKDIRDLTVLLLQAGHKVSWLDRFVGSSLILANPRSANAWARVEAFLPFAAPAQRPSIVLTKSRHLQAYSAVENTFQEMWKVAKPQK